MVALERPFIATGWDCGLQSGAPICLQYGSVTHLYTLPYVPREEQVSYCLTYIEICIPIGFQVLWDPWGSLIAHMFWICRYPCSVLEVCLVKLIFDWLSRYSTYNKWHVLNNSSHEHEFGLVLKVTVGSSQSVNKWAKHRTEQLAGCGPREDKNQSVFMSQVMLPRDSQGSVDFNNFPYRVCSWS
jgi:hypothetical protein